MEVSYLDKSLYIVVLGGRAKGFNIELHDVRWVIGKNIEDTFLQLQQDWFGKLHGLHIDSYIKVEYIDGYIVRIKSLTNLQNKSKSSSSPKSLWFVNLGAYAINDLYEKHNFNLIVATNKQKAKQIAKERWVENFKNKHCDDIQLIKGYYSKGIKDGLKGNWEVILEPDLQNRSQQMIPDWIGYKRIDK
ncbi:DUF1543 domain-containing protein [Prochlorococcus marinus]|uniref:DUF1543 domain-containing protein n=1 Tax=Prochlorococcus marinus (strain MIT 9211) TaxID=93059 RepID=A9BA61_PROM4|nr:DUF1543 domain-containing protein [Prochlorococcus marinus]ABX08723.1 Hypothetical protein P9211_07921 [Prochlorococcus marinus str. MIT 9211]